MDDYNNNKDDINKLYDAIKNLTATQTKISKISNDNDSEINQIKLILEKSQNNIQKIINNYNNLIFT